MMEKKTLLIFHMVALVKDCRYIYLDRARQ